MPGRRPLNALGFAVGLSLIAYAYYAEVVLKLEPCPLCIFQRVGVALLTLAFLAALLHHPRTLPAARIHAALVGLTALLTCAVAARHIYIQHQPPGSVPACGATLDFMLEVFPLTDVIRRVFTGSGECAKLDWSLFGLSMPAWVLLAAVALGAFGVWNNAWRSRLAAPPAR